MIKHKEENVVTLHKDVEAINDSAERAVQDSKKTFYQMLHLLEQQCTEVE